MATQTSRRPLYSASIRPRPRQDGSTAYDVRYRVDGISKTLSFDQHPAAEKWAAVVRKVGPEQALAFLSIATKAGTPTVEEYLEVYLASKSGIEPLTIEHYRMFMRLHIGPTLGHLPLDGVSKAAVAGWVNGMASDGSSSKSIKNRHGFLSAMFQNAVDDGLIGSNPCAKTRMPETERVEMVFLSPDEFTTLLGYIPTRYQPLVQLLANTGMRWGEVSALRPSDFDLGRRSVKVSRAWKYSSASGPYIGPPKTKRSNRTIELSPNIIPILRLVLEAAGEYVFTNTRGNPLRENSFWKAIWAPARRLANGLPPYEHEPLGNWTDTTRHSWAGIQPAQDPINKWPRIHDLRHSSVAWLLERGVGMDVISRRLGHESIKTTLDIYGHVAPDRLWDAADQMDVALAGALPSIEG